MITAGELAIIQGDAQQAMPDTVTILRRTLTSDGQGGQQQSYASIGTNICRLMFAGGNRPIIPDSESAGKIDPMERYIATLPYNVTVLETDRLTINSTTYEIVSILAVRSYETAKRLLVKRI